MIKDKILILGVGNQYRQDDGVGVEAINQLQQRQLPGCDLVVGGIDGLALLDIIAKYQRVIIIDAVDMRQPPGTLRLFTPQEAKINIESDAMSTHGIGVAEVLALLEKLGTNTKVKVLGVQPKDINFGEGLTEDVERKIPEIVEMIICATQSLQK